jgi:hypothetical protein
MSAALVLQPRLTRTALPPGTQGIRLESLGCPTRAISLNPQRYCAWRDAMDDHGQLEYATATGNDYLAHEQMYRTFVTLTKAGIVVIAVIVILMAIFLT